MTSITRCHRFPSDVLPCVIPWQAVQSRKEFYKQCADLEKSNSLSHRFYYDALRGAIIHGSPLVVRDITRIAGKELFNYEDFGKKTPLIWAILKSRPLVIRDIAWCGANLNMTTTEGKTALWYAMRANKVPLVVFLLKNGAKTSGELNEKEKQILTRAQSAIHNEIDTEARQLQRSIPCMPMEVAKIIAMYVLD